MVGQQPVSAGDDSMLWWQIYLYGALIAAAGTSVAADLFSDHRSSPQRHTGLTIAAGVLWPVLLIGLLQFACISVLAKVLRSRSTTKRIPRLAAGR
jgi:hypothetical protein